MIVLPPVTGDLRPHLECLPTDGRVGCSLAGGFKFKQKIKHRQDYPGRQSRAEGSGKQYQPDGEELRMALLILA